MKFTYLGIFIIGEQNFLLINTVAWETFALRKRRGVAEDGEGGGGRAGVSPYPRGAWVAAWCLRSRYAGCSEGGA